ncbi:hypothetical protein N657DRAFT_231423 [Parathielavia appendiculata]|uniref:Uncharacterized protein n=1 Tax=Parathielavia appendiculata TaxID=2587402 RepID=A0AAN6Z6T9_9PEZI|nr:hypothetical protein N657DRAFT_231423 [Parathielavia appendiculata]
MTQTHDARRERSAARNSRKISRLNNERNERQCYWTTRNDGSCLYWFRKTNEGQAVGGLADGALQGELSTPSISEMYLQHAPRLHSSGDSGAHAAIERPTIETRETHRVRLRGVSRSPGETYSVHRQPSAGSVWYGGIKETEKCTGLGQHQGGPECHRGAKFRSPEPAHFPGFQASQAGATSRITKPTLAIVSQPSSFCNDGRARTISAPGLEYATTLRSTMTR